ncbi:uncharacterized protein TRUGW13939_09826 [Talaromyces rugulosus]|uniref:Protein kinase domain-containing protein n=1 Tax=Talaromyces rugulosus TaxID=121627 RepID=A0A7H8RB33_TALRU|nr:uncharacterized protein TRUGW13939_09826 [Talaromyces rugulosus]QKX62665.1 hypothetical protein TRUGW13939_09826 [Talaromyces rugulosus]
MASSLNRILQGRHMSYKLIEVLKSPSIFKATAVPPKSPQVPSDNKHVVIKDLALEWELRAHQLPAIKPSPYIRQTLDVIEKREDEDWGPSPPSITKRIVLEWMDTDLWLARPFDKSFSNPRLPQIVARSILEALVVFQEMQGVHTDVNPNNIFISDLSDLDVFLPTVKLGDLDNAWCLAKIFRLVGPIDTPGNPEYKDDFELAAGLETSGYLDPSTGEPKPYVSVGPLPEELQTLPRDICSDSCVDFIEHLLVIDPAKRPTAKVALQHPFLQSTTG